MNSRETLNNPISNNSLKINNSSDARNFKTTFNNGGAYTSTSYVTILTLSHTPKYTGSTVVVQFQALISLVSLNNPSMGRYCALFRDGVAAAGSEAPFYHLDTTQNLPYAYAAGNTYSYANSANNVAITYTIQGKTDTSGAGWTHRYGSISAWEILP